MKNCDEMYNSLLERREQYEIAQKRKKKRIAVVAASLCCLCAVAVSGTVAVRGGFSGSFYENTETNNGSVTDSGTASAETPDISGEDKIIINSVETPEIIKNGIALHTDDFVKMSREELNLYYGVNIFPAVPEDLIDENKDNLGVFKRDSGTGEIYWDGVTLCYASADGSRTLNVNVSKDSAAGFDIMLSEQEMGKSVISGADVSLYSSDGGYYYAGFEKYDVGFSVFSKGLSLDEFVFVVSSLV